MRDQVCCPSNKTLITFRFPFSCCAHSKEQTVLLHIYPFVRAAICIGLTVLIFIILQLTFMLRRNWLSALSQISRSPESSRLLHYYCQLWRKIMYAVLLETTKFRHFCNGNVTAKHHGILFCTIAIDLDYSLKSLRCDAERPNDSDSVGFISRKKKTPRENMDFVRLPFRSSMLSHRREIQKICSFWLREFIVCGRFSVLYTMIWCVSVALQL